ncbi:leader peptidase (prepilin peptidase)/N-methyltransferase [Lipingzhangella halophila]|uniref:Leader peptidase (Prepilin peptidase)/N-methyltransferase n=1 Tax=Lipingzhangella halophila TaxID=1783352 RepID=A0A7W7W1G1_9ACTN|nr:A24 family peptidase [Lipingzhangella halophila]MBB4930927.1 leader peptidase (prepilin peptidase)/N-methyltransferase [Lipingzhangella halophila]
MPSATVLALTICLALLGAVAGMTAGRVIPLFPRHDPEPDDESGPPPPTCPHCGAEVPWPRWAPLPLRFLVKTGCQDCGRRVHAPAVTIWVAALLLGTLAFTGADRFPVEIAAFAFFAIWGALLTVIDARVHRLPNRLVLTSYPVALVLLAAAALTMPDGTTRFTMALIGMAGLAVFYWVLWVIYPAGMGWGDVKMAGLLGLFLGWGSLGSVVSGTFLAFLFSATFGITLIVLRRATRKTAIPFGPFMIIGAFAVITVGDPLPLLLG